jgi:photosystem II stability/assembly factor-like uncharacterized protein
MRLIISKRNEHSKLVEQNYSLLSTIYYLKKLIFILLSITIGSCYSIESDCDCDNVTILPIVPVLPEDDFSWELTNAPPSVWSISVGSNEDIWATSSRIVYLSTDNGDTWIQKYNGYNALSLIRSIAVNPINGYIFFSTSENGLFRSTDNGETWVQVTNDIALHGIIVALSGEIYVQGSYIYYSNDNGDTWIEKNNGFSSSVFSLALGIDGMLYTGFFYRGVYRSTDGGNTWLPPIHYSDASIYGLTVSADGSIFAAVWDIGVLKSTDRGVTWIQVNNGFDKLFDAYRIIYNPITRDIFVGDGSYNSKIYRSTDLGASWELKNNGIVDNQQISSFAFNPITGQMYVVANSRGVYRSRDGK